MPTKTTAATGATRSPRTATGSYSGSRWPCGLRMRPHPRGSLTPPAVGATAVDLFRQPPAPSLSPRPQPPRHRAHASVGASAAAASAIRTARASRVILGSAPWLSALRCWLSSCPRLWACRRPDLKSSYSGDRPMHYGRCVTHQCQFDASGPAGRMASKAGVHWRHLPELSRKFEYPATEVQSNSVASRFLMLSAM